MAATKPGRPGASRVTIADVAARAGVSAGAVSYALNGRPGVGAATRARILAVAQDMGWTPNGAARRLAGASSETVGLVLVGGAARTLGVSSFYMDFIRGIESAMQVHRYGLLLQVVPDAEAELAVYRRWQGSDRVDGVILVDVREQDPRIELLRELSVPAVVAGPPEAAGGLPCVWTDDGAAMEEAVQYLVALGHRRIGRIAGTAELAHVRIRNAAFSRAIERAGAEGETRHADFDLDKGGRATRSILLGPQRPTALLYDDAYLAVSSLSVARELGIDVPGELSVLAWDDSPVCEVTTPSLSAMRHDVGAYGEAVMRALFDMLDGGSPGSRLGPVPVITPRGSTARPPR